MARTSNLSPFERHLREVLASAGFEVDVFRGGHVLESPTALAVLETRRGKWSTATEIEVLMSISVTSRVLADTFRQPFLAAPLTWESQWHHDPIHNEGDSTVDLWDVPKDDPASWDRRDADLTRRIIPMLVDHASDEGLVRCWRDHPRHWWPPRIRRLIYRALLERATGADPSTTIGLVRRYVRRCPSAPGLTGMGPGLAALG